MACEGITIETTTLDEVIEVGVVGPQGPSGAAGVGVPTGGITGYILAKKTSADYDTQWIFNSGGGGDLSSPPPIGDVTPNTGAFTSLSAVDVTVTNLLTVGSGGSIDFSGASSISLPAILTSLAIADNANFNTGTFRALPDSLTANRTYDLPDASGTLALTSDFAAPPAIGSTTPAAGTFTTLTANNGTITASAPVLTLAQTWNNAAVTFTGARIDITNTASGTGSRFLDCMVGGASAIRLARVGSTPYALFGTADNGIGAISTSQPALIANGGVAFVVNSGSGGAYIRSDSPYAWASSTNLTGATTDLFLRRDAANTLAQYNSTNPQTFNIYNTHSSSTNHERGFLKWSANSFLVGTEKGSGGGTARNLELQTDGTTRMTIAGTSNAITCTGSLSIVSNLTFQGNSSIVGNIASGVLRLLNAGQSGFDRLQFGGSTTSFPALKRDGTALQARLANDSDFCPLQGQLRIHQNAVAETPTATHTMTLFDASGTAYKVLCVAA